MSKHDLYDKYLNGLLSEAEEKELIQILEDDEKSQSFTNYLVETNMMVSAAENCESFVRQTSKKKTHSLVVIMAAMVAISLFIVFRPTENSFEVVASSISKYKQGTILNDTSVSIGEGRLTLKDSTGNNFQLNGPAELKVQSITSMSLFKGSMLTTLSPEVDSFILNLPNGVIEDLGTSFGAIVKEDTSEVHVFTGKVEVRSESHSRRLVEGQSIALGHDGLLQEIDFKEDIFDLNKADVVFMGNRQLHPGEQMELFLDATGGTLTGQISLSFDKQKDFRYKLMAYSAAKKVFESKVYRADDQYEMNIPTKKYQDLTLEMKVISGYVTNGILNVKNLNLITEGSRPYEGDVLIQAHSEWRYYFKGLPPQGWKLREFDDSKWLKGESSIGYGDKDLRTIIGGNELRRSVYHIYLRHKFDLGNLEVNSLKNIKAYLLADDGAVVFINGKEALRHNLPDGLINDETRALKTSSKDSGEMIYSNFSVPASLLTSGINTVSVILFQKKGKSSDMRFDLKMMAF
ncbi:MAG: FecR family protein [Lentisphaeraceae bacterium]|nr:FecR family protein [Lentisphaeraceae bacterium]